MNGRPLIAGAALVAATSVVLVGCGSDSSNTNIDEDTSITIDGTLTGDDSVTLGDIDTGSGNEGTE
jgi:hypothetical protein